MVLLVKDKILSIVTEIYLSQKGATVYAGNVQIQHAGFDANLNAATISSNNYNLVASDNGKVVTIDNSTTDATVSIPANLGDGFNCLVVQKGDHQTTIQIVSGSGVTIANRSSETKTAGQYAVISIINIGSETYILFCLLEYFTIVLILILVNPNFCLLL